VASGGERRGGRSSLDSEYRGAVSIPPHAERRWVDRSQGPRGVWAGGAGVDWLHDGGGVECYCLDATTPAHLNHLHSYVLVSTATPPVTKCMRPSGTTSACGLKLLLVDEA
jgi:hypothetical protein